MPGPYCILCYKRDKSVSYYGFPKNEEYRKKWLDFCNIEEVVLSTATKLCSDHFEEDQLIKKSKRRFLKPNALPTITNKKSKRKHQHTEHNMISDRITINRTADDSNMIAENRIINETVTGTIDIIVDNEITNSEINNRIVSKKIDCDDDVNETVNMEIHSEDGIIIDENNMPSSDACQTDNCPSTSANSAERNCFETPTKKVLEPRYVGDIRTPHLATPKKARRALEMTKCVIAKQKRKIKTLQQDKIRLIQRIKTMEELIKHLRKKDLLSETTAEHLTVTQNNDNNYN